jgi:putative ABC transport system permease protein
MTGKQYVLKQIQGIGANLIDAEDAGGSQRINNAADDPLTIEDVQAVQRDVPAIVAASPIVSLSDRIPIGGGKERDILVLGVYPEYRSVRNLVVLTGRFFDTEDEQGHNKVGVITQKMANTLYGSTEAAIGKSVRLSGLPFTVIGTFRERVDTFGQSEVLENTMLIPYTVSRYFTGIPNLKQLLLVATCQWWWPQPSRRRRFSRGIAESVYNVTNLTELVSVASKKAAAQTGTPLLL